MKKLRLGIMGLGPRAEVHLHHLSRFPGVELAAFCDTDPVALEKRADQYGVLARYTQVEEMLERVELDAAFVLVNGGAIYEVAKACLQWGLHTLLEKPPGTCAAETRELAALAARNECQAMVGYSHRFMPVLHEARALVERKGPVTCALAEFHHDLCVWEAGGPPEPVRNDLLTAQASRGLDFLRWLGGRVREVHGRADSVCTGRPDSFHALLEFENGMVGHFLSNNYTAAHVERGEMHAREASAYLEGIGQRAQVLLDGVEFDLRPRGVDADGCGAQTRFFLDHLRDGRPLAYPACTLAEAVETMEVIEAIYSSRET
jgi:predicted dehydrogenase